MRELIRLSDKAFTAGVELEGDRVVKTAPLLRYMMGWTGAKVHRYAQIRNWDVELTDAPAPNARRIEIGTGS
jgi:hypothetical protein